MMMIFVAALLAAPTAGPAQLGCVEQELTPAVRDALRKSAARLAGGEGAVPDAAGDAAADTGLEAAAATCRARFHWSEAAMRDAAALTKLPYGRVTLHRRARAAGLDVGRIETAALSLSAADRTSLVEGDMRGIDSMFRALQAAGIDMASGQAPLIGQLGIFAVMGDEMPRRFATE